MGSPPSVSTYSELLTARLPQNTRANFFDDRLHNLRHEGLALITEAYYALYPEKKGEEMVYCFFDEIQPPGWEPFVDRIMRTEKCEVYLTGSANAVEGDRDADARTRDVLGTIPILIP